MSAQTKVKPRPQHRSRLWHCPYRTASCGSGKFDRTASCGRSDPSCGTAVVGTPLRSDHGRSAAARALAPLKPHSMVRPHGIVWQVRPGLWHRSNRTALCVRTSSRGRSYSAAASRQTHRRHRGGGRSSHGSAAAHYTAAWCRHSSQRRGGHGSQDAYQAPGALSSSPEVARMT